LNSKFVEELIMSPDSKTNRSVSICVFSIIAFIFGGLTIKSGGLVLFTTGEFHQQQGNFVTFCAQVHNQHPDFQNQFQPRKLCKSNVY